MILPQISFGLLSVVASPLSILNNVHFRLWILPELQFIHGKSVSHFCTELLCRCIRQVQDQTCFACSKPLVYLFYTVQSKQSHCSVYHSFSTVAVLPYLLKTTATLVYKITFCFT